ncbi:MAG: HAMP domain-containing histidine kinase, partial [Ferruginibacter sp.]|nr:HAMP domain-containing histidine kinase [Ferruginibacter sp.]
ELLDEMNTELNKGDIEEAKALAADVKQNLEKINHHGQRAADIVKGMLQHSRSSTGQKEPTDINALCDEYLRLAYHGLRAKDKSFNAKFETDFDNTLPKINIVPQDIGRVILNLINNAFYAASLNPSNLSAVAEGETLEPGVKKDPMIWVRTKREGHKVLISVKDNGPGIPDNIKDKIFQPFFTTKPTGQGTGLGLNLSYDIVKAHGGEIKVESADGAGTDFIVLLPG